MVSFTQRFGSALNAHTHLQVCMTDGLFSATGSQLRFHPARLSERDRSAVQRAIHHRVLRSAERHGCLTPEAIADRKGWEHGGGFSVQAGVLIDAKDHAARER